MNYSLVKKITVGKSPGEILFDDKSRNLYVANSESKSLSIISPDTLEVERTVLLGEKPFSIAYDEADRLVYVTNEGDNTLSVINPDDCYACEITHIPVGSTNRWTLYFRVKIYLSN